jgi:hypothetical protein
MKANVLKHLILLCLTAATFTGCVVERRVERPRGCRHAVWVGSRHHGHWECSRPRHAIIVR